MISSDYSIKEFIILQSSRVLEKINFFCSRACCKEEILKVRGENVFMNILKVVFNH
jgi:hypothetical protein